MSAALLAPRPKQILAASLESFSDDWESGNNTNWATVTGAPSVAGTYKDTGSNGVRLLAANSANFLGSGNAKFGQTHPWFSTRSRIQFRSFSVATARTPVLTIQNTNQTDNVDCGISSTGQFWVIDVANADAATAAFGPSLNTWYTVRIRGFFGAGGLWDAWLSVDGVEILHSQSVEVTPRSVRAVTMGTAATNISFETWNDNFKIVVADVDPGWIT